MDYGIVTVCDRMNDQNLSVLVYKLRLFFPSVQRPLK